MMYVTNSAVWCTYKCCCQYQYIPFSKMDNNLTMNALHHHVFLIYSINGHVSTETSYQNSSSSLHFMNLFINRLEVYTKLQLLWCSTQQYTSECSRMQYQIYNVPSMYLQMDESYIYIYNRLNIMKQIIPPNQTTRIKIRLLHHADHLHWYHIHHFEMLL